MASSAGRPLHRGQRAARAGAAVRAAAPRGARARESGSSGSSGSGGASDAGDAGGPTGDGGCSVSWTTDVFPNLESTGSGTCGTAACHGGANPPTIVDNDPTTTWKNLDAYQINGAPYVGATNAAIECNTGITSPVCGLLQMPEAPGTLSATVRTAISTWVACGAPNN